MEGVGAPKNTPHAVIDRLNQEINSALVDPKLSTRLRELGGEPTPMSPTEFGQFIAVETDKWAKVIMIAGLKAE